MSKMLKKITKDVQVGIYDGQYVAKVYDDKILLTSPYVKWTDNNGVYAEAKLRTKDKSIIDQVISCLSGACEDQALAVIGHHFGDDYLSIGVQ